MKKLEIIVIAAVISLAIFAFASMQVKAQGPASYFEVSAPSSVTAGQPFDVTVTACDSSGNTVTDYAGTITFSTTDLSLQTMLPASYSFQLADQGQVTFYVASGAGATLVTAGSQQITVTDENEITGSDTIQVDPASASSFVVSASSLQTAGAFFPVTVTAYDQFGNVATEYSGTFSFFSSDGGSQVVLPSDQSLVDGSGTFSVTLVTAGTQTVTASDDADSAITGSQSGITVSPAEASYIVVTPSSENVVAGQPERFTVNSYDQYGNLIGDVTSQCAFTVGGQSVANPLTENAAVPYTVTASYSGFFANADWTVIPADLNALTVGVSSPSVVAGNAETLTATGYDQYGNNLGSQSVTFTVNGVAISGNSVTENSVGDYAVSIVPIGSVTVTSTDFEVNADTLNYITISPASSGITAGASQVYSAEGFDQYGNDLGSVTAVYSIESGADGSVVGSSVSATKVGSWTVTASYAGVSDVTATLTVAPAGLDHFVFNSVGVQTEGTPFTITATAVDAFGNTVAAYVGTPSLTFSAGSISPSVMNAFVGGVGSSLVTVNAAGSGVTIIAADGANSGRSNSFTVNPTIDASTGANGRINPTGTVVVNYGDSQSFTITPNPGYHTSSLTVDGLPVTAASLYTFSDVQASHNITAAFAINTYTITVTQSGNGTIAPGTSTVSYGGSQNFVVTPNSGYSIASITTDAGSVAVTSPSGQTVSFTDVEANHTVTATYAPNSYKLTVYTVGQGSVTPGNGTYTYGTIVSLQASSADGWSFGGWSNDNTGSTIMLTMGSDQNVTASFTQNTQSTPTSTPASTPNPAQTEPTPAASTSPSPSSTSTANPSSTPTNAATAEPTSPPSSATSALASIGSVFGVVAAAVILGVVVIGLVKRRRKPSSIIILN
jgi:cell division septation protein DedD